MPRHPIDCVCTPCCDNDALRDNMIHDIDRQERRAAARFAGPNSPADCRHHMVPDGSGGGSCIYCPETVSAGEL